MFGNNNVHGILIATAIAVIAIDIVIALNVEQH